MSKYKMVTCDLDGTLIGNDLKISEKNLNAIHQMNKQGVIFVPSSGRVLSEMKIISDNPDVRYIICSSGASVIDKEKGEIIDFGIPSDINKNLFQVLDKYDIYNIAHIYGKNYTDANLRGQEDEYNIPDPMYDVITCAGTPLEDFRKRVGDKKLECVCPFFRFKEERRKCYEELMEDGNFKITRPWPYNLDIFYKEAGKANAVKALALKLGIDMNEVISIGDGDNDIESLKQSKIGIAVSNATDAVKEIADEIACSNDEDVAEYVLRKYL